MFCQFDEPEEIHSVQGHNFESQVFEEVCQWLVVRKSRTTPLHPESDGLVVWFTHTLATQLAILETPTCPWSYGHTGPQSKTGLSDGPRLHCFAQL